MRKVIQIAHKFCDYTCYVNGLEDALASRGPVTLCARSPMKGDRTILGLELTELLLPRLLL